MTAPRRCYKVLRCLDMRSISQRELRNDNAEIVRRVEAGESFTVTRRGVPVALLTPYRPGADLRCDRPARYRTTFSGRDLPEPARPTADVLEDLRGER